MARLAEKGRDNYCLGQQFANKYQKVFRDRTQENRVHIYGAGGGNKARGGRIFVSDIYVTRITGNWWQLARACMCVYTSLNIICYNFLSMMSL